MQNYREAGFQLRLEIFKYLILIDLTGVARNFDWEGPKLGKKLWPNFGDIFRWRNGDDVTEKTS